jgi:hypothetical protein
MAVRSAKTVGFVNRRRTVLRGVRIWVMRTTIMHHRRLAALLAFAASAGACSSSPSGAPAPSASASAAAAQTAPNASTTGSADKSDEVRPNYPRTKDPPDPLAQSFCAAVQEVPAKRKAECCKGTADVEYATECSRVLSFALREKAVTLKQSEVDACRAAVEAATQGCDWGDLRLKTPDACLDVIHGALKEGARCRSSFECVDGLTCRGVGPTDLGVCGAPAKPGGACARPTDPLAAWTAQTKAVKHPTCDGACIRGRCLEVVPLGGACKSSLECGDKLCVDDKCSDAKLPHAGEACLGAYCAADARCVDRKCVASVKVGDACKDDRDCGSQTCGDKHVCEPACRSAVDKLRHVQQHK